MVIPTTARAITTAKVSAELPVTAAVPSSDPMPGTPVRISAVTTVMTANVTDSGRLARVQATTKGRRIRVRMRQLSAPSRRAFCTSSGRTDVPPS